MNFTQEVEQILRNSFARDRSPAQLVESWAQFVGWCEEGYSWDVSEYDNEMSIRRVIEQLLSDPRLRHFPELTDFKTQVESIDEKFKRLLNPSVAIPNREYWWEAGVLRSAGQPYAEYFRDAYGIHVDAV